MRSVWLTCVLAGCSYTAPNASPIEPDAAIDSPPPGCATFSTMFDSCALPPGAPVTLSGTLTFDTNTGDLFADAAPVEVETATLMTPGGGEIKAILGSAIVLAPGTTLRAIGARGFAIVATESITLEADTLIDVSIAGAGARTACPNAAMRGTDRNGGGSGGGGGGFGAAGGDGGSGDADGTTLAPGGVGGAAIATPAGILGGCPGEAGGDDNNDPGGRGGVAGGAVYLAAGQRIDMVASAGIDAGGEGGLGGEQSGINSGDGGGGGGGSGGMIVLESPMISALGTLAANGGGGGEGSGDGDDGNPGERGRFDTVRAPGGGGSSPTGTDGGDGGAKLDPAGGTNATPLNGGGGGGGGAVGFIRLIADTLDVSAVVSPVPN